MAINYENLNDGGHKELAKQIFAKIKTLTDGLNSDISTLNSNKVDKVTGKGLSTNDFTDEDKAKLDGLLDDVPQSDWLETDTEKTSYIQNKPTSMPASDVYAWAKAVNKPTYTASEVGLGNVPNVTTNDQTPTYTASSSLSALTSGEKISVAFGKIAKAVADLISHINNTNNPHSVTKSQVGLGNVGNFKAVSTVANQGLTDDEKANARTNIGAGDSSFTGDYNDLANKPTIPTKTSQLTNDSGFLTSHQDISGKADKSSTVSNVAYDSTNKKLTKTINGTTSDVVTVATIKTALALAKADVGLGNVENKSSATIRGELTKDNVTTALGYTPPTTNTTYGVVSKTANGLAPQLPNETTTTKYLRQDGTWQVPPNTDTNNRKSFYGTCATAAATKDKVVTLSDTTGWELRAGVIVGVKFTYTNTYSSATANPVTLNVNGSGAKNIWYNVTHSGAGNTGTNNVMYGYANRVNYYMYDGTYWVWMSDGAETGNNYHAVCFTAAATAAKAATASWYVLRTHNRFTLYLQITNTAASALTLNVNGTGAKPLYINGSASSSSNYTLPAGTYEVYYNGTNYYVRTDAYSLGNAEGTASNVRGTVAVANGGTGQTTLAAARNAMGLGNTTGALPIANGGTGATTAANARTNLGLGNVPIPTILTSTLTAGNTSLSFTNAAITSTARFDVYADVFGVAPTDMVQSSTTLTLTFAEQAVNVAIKLVIYAN